MKNESYDHMVLRIVILIRALAFIGGIIFIIKLVLD